MDLALFDLDKTLISDDSTSLWLQWLVSQGYTSTSSLQENHKPNAFRHHLFSLSS